jgi:hypothetical protein
MDWVVAVTPNRLGSEDTESHPIPAPVLRRLDRWPASRDAQTVFPPDRGRGPRWTWRGCKDRQPTLPHNTGRLTILRSPLD